MYGDLSNALLTFAWKFTASNTKRQLAPLWAATTVVAAGDAMSNGGNVYVTPAGGTTGATAPTATGLLPALDGTVQWVGYPLAGVKFLTVINTDLSNVATVGDVNLQVVPVPFNYGSTAQVPPNPLGVYAVASAGSPVLVVGAGS